MIAYDRRTKKWRAQYTDRNGDTESYEAEGYADARAWLDWQKEADCNTRPAHCDAQGLIDND